MLDTSSRTKAIDQLNELIAIDHDAIAAYNSAIERLENPLFRQKMQQYRNDHERHVQYLQDKIRFLGGEPRVSADMKKMMTQGLVILAGVLGDDESILKAMKTNEDQTNQAYEEAVNKLHGLIEVEPLVEENLHDERVHRAWIEATLAQIH